MSDLANDVRDLISKSRSESARSIYGQTGLGVSDIGHCREHSRRKLLDFPRDDNGRQYDLAALVGTAVGTQLELEYLTHVNPRAKIQRKVVVKFEVTINGVPWVLHIPGHPDVIDSENDRLIDWKTADGLTSNMSTDQQRFQVSLYADACIKMGWLTPQCTLALVHIDRSGRNPEPLVDEWVFEPVLVQEAYEWLNDVLYAISNGEEASRDMPRTWCWSVCEYATACRGSDSTVEGLIENQFVIDAIEFYKDAAARAKKAEEDKKAAAATLQDIEGRTADWTVKWTPIGGGPVAYERKPYLRLDISPNRPARRRGKKDEEGGRAGSVAGDGQG
jgi:hypothetical protein